MKLVILESPYAGDIEANTRFARRCLRDCLLRGEAPIASHLLFTQEGVLRDEIPEERALGIKAGLLWLPRADYSVYYTDHGWSRGMLSALHDWTLKLGYDFRIRGLEKPAMIPSCLHEEIETLLASKAESPR